MLGRIHNGVLYYTNSPRLRSTRTPHALYTLHTFPKFDLPSLLDLLNTFGRKPSEYPRKGTLGIPTVVNPRWYRIHLAR